MLRCIGISLFVCVIGLIILSTSRLWDIAHSDYIQDYISCTELGFNGSNATSPGNYEMGYWKIGPFILYGIGKAASSVLLLEFIFAQSPERMKGLVIGLLIAFRTILLLFDFLKFVRGLCYDLVSAIIIVVLFLVFLVLSKCYTLRERNREINIQAIVEEHYERYMEQEEEYMREHHDEYMNLDEEESMDQDEKYTRE